MKGELRFENNDDKERVLRLMEAWRKAINDASHREWHMGAFPKPLQRSVDEFIEHQRKSMEAQELKGEPVLHEWMVQLERNYARFIDKDF